MFVASIATALGAMVVVGYALRPLRRVAATATSAVAHLPLSDDENRITDRVGERDLESSSEVGVVGHTLNWLLDNVDETLAMRAESDRRMRQFYADASHEMRTPLAAIHGSEARRMSSLVEELLLLARLDEGRDLASDVIDLVDLVLNATNDASVSSTATSG